MTRNRKILLGLATAAALAASAISYAAPGGPGAGWGPCPHAGEGPGMMEYGPGAGRGGPGMMGMMGYGPGYGRSGPGMWGGGPGRGPAFSPSATVEGRLAALKSELKITGDQESAWQAFATKARAQAESMQAVRGQAPAQAQTAPERLAQRAEFARQRAANLDAITAAVKDLYAALTPEQKAVADQRLAFAGMGPMGGRGYRR